MVCSQPIQEMEHSADVLSAGLLEVANPSLSNRYFLKQVITSIWNPCNFLFHKSWYLIFFLFILTSLWISSCFLSANGSIGLMNKMKHKILLSTSPYGNLICPKIKKIREQLEKRNTGVFTELMAPEWSPCKQCSLTHNHAQNIGCSALPCYPSFENGAYGWAKTTKSICHGTNL
jgi:hypothetical protein